VKSNNKEIKNIKLSVIIPGYNEDDKIRSNLESICSYLDKNIGEQWEVIFIDDGSTDNTFFEASQISKNDKRVKIISYKNNRGRGHALRKGIDISVGEYVLTTESDLNYGLGIISNLFNSIIKIGSDIVVASPYMVGGSLKNIPIMRRFFSYFGNKILSLSIGNIIQTLTGMVRIYKKDCIKSLPLVSEDKEIHLEIISKAIHIGFRISEIPAVLAWPEKKQQKKSNRKSTFKAKKYIISHLIFSFFERPFLLFGLIGGGTFTSGILLGIYVIFLRYNGSLNPERPLMTLVVLMVLGGILIISFGLIGMQVNDLRKEIFRIQKHMQSKKDL